MQQDKLLQSTTLRQGLFQAEAISNCADINTNLLRSARRIYKYQQYDWDNNTFSSLPVSCPLHEDWDSNMSYILEYWYMLMNTFVDNQEQQQQQSSIDFYVKWDVSTPLTLRHKRFQNMIITTHLYGIATGNSTKNELSAYWFPDVKTFNDWLISLPNMPIL